MDLKLGLPVLVRQRFKDLHVADSPVRKLQLEEIIGPRDDLGLAAGHLQRLDGMAVRTEEDFRGLECARARAGVLVADPSQDDALRARVHVQESEAKAEAQQEILGGFFHLW